MTISQGLNVLIRLLIDFLNPAWHNLAVKNIQFLLTYNRQRSLGWVTSHSSRVVPSLVHHLRAPRGTYVSPTTAPTKEVPSHRRCDRGSLPVLEYAFLSRRPATPRGCSVVTPVSCLTPSLPFPSRPPRPSPVSHVLPTIYVDDLCVGRHGRVGGLPQRRGTMLPLKRLCSDLRNVGRSGHKDRRHLNCEATVGRRYVPGLSGTRLVGLLHEFSGTDWRTEGAVEGVRSLLRRRPISVKSLCLVGWVSGATSVDKKIRDDEVGVDGQE